jgi:hypothetical protein
MTNGLIKINGEGFRRGPDDKRFIEWMNGPEGKLFFLNLNQKAGI